MKMEHALANAALASLPIITLSGSLERTMRMIAAEGSAISSGTVSTTAGSSRSRFTPVCGVFVLMLRELKLARSGVGACGAKEGASARTKKNTGAVGGRQDVDCDVGEVGEEA